MYMALKLQLFTNCTDAEISLLVWFIFLDMFSLFQAGALDKLEAFTSFNGPDFYGLPRNTSKIILRKNAWKVPATYKHSSGEIVPMFSGSTLEWFPSDQPKE
jgi:dihydroorotase